MIGKNSDYGLKIKNFKSLLDLEIRKGNPFTVFIGPNGSGKSNIFEALEYWRLHDRMEGAEIDELFDGPTNFLPFNQLDNDERQICLSFQWAMGGTLMELSKTYELSTNGRMSQSMRERTDWDQMNENIFEASSFHQNFTRLWLKGNQALKIPIQDENRLAPDGSNLEKVLKRMLKNEQTGEEMNEWLQLLVPGFERMRVHSNPNSGVDDLLIYEKGLHKPFTLSLLSQGTYHLLALLTAVYQSEHPQFLCIEAPENGLHPKVIRELVPLLRYQCEEKGHFIWLNTHSQTLVAELRPEEIILVDKKNGATQIKQLKEKDLQGLQIDEAWLTNVLGGGLPC